MDIISGNFTWNEHKERANVLKHHIDFYTAATAFDDPGKKIFVDEKHSIKEQRYFCIAKIQGRIVTVRFIYRNKLIRIIGAGYWRQGKEYYEKKEN